MSKLARVRQIAHINKFACAIALIRKFEFEVPQIKLVKGERKIKATRIHARAKHNSINT